MGEIADLILEGMLCQICGCYMWDETGYPRTCPSCEEEEENEMSIESEPEWDIGRDAGLDKI